MFWTYTVLLSQTVLYAEERSPHSIQIQLRLDGTSHNRGFGSQFVYRWKPKSQLGIDFIGGVGYLRQSPNWLSDMASIYLSIGPSWHKNISHNFSIYSGIRFLHLHHATLESWRNTPFANLTGDSAGGVLHRSGFGMAIGCSQKEVVKTWGANFSWENEVSMHMVPSSTAYFFFASFATGLRWVLP